MLKKIFSRKLFVTTAVLFALLLVYIVPKENNYTLETVKQKLTYVDKEIIKENIYLYDSNNYLARTEVIVSNNDK